jgi:mono/diheme cytochrome c family protein
VIVNGIPGTAMPAWRDLPQRDLESLVAFLKSLEKASNDPQLSAIDAAHAQKVFQANCSSCHGTTGDGNGPASGGLLVCPTNFKTEQPAKEEIAEALNKGVAGTSMPTWKEQLSDSDRQVLAGYVRSLYTGD